MRTTTRSIVYEPARQISRLKERASQAAVSRRTSSWRPRSVALIVLLWLVLHIGGLFSPGLLDDVDSVYIEIAREMLVRHDFVTPYVDGIRFFDKPPLMYWLAAGSMHLFGTYDWAARLPLALLTLALLLATYALGVRLFASISPAGAPDRGGLYAALALGTSIGPYVYTRFFIPDIVVTLWLTLSVSTFLLATDRARCLMGRAQPGRPALAFNNAATEEGRSSLLPMLGFGATVALSLLTKGFIGVVFPLVFAALYLLLTHQLPLLRRLHLLATGALCLAIALPWHLLVARRNPPIALPSGLGLPSHAGWAWFYLYNEHVARFLSRRIPHDYGQVPIPLFWLLTAVWIAPWAAFLPGALAQALRLLRRPSPDTSMGARRTVTALLLWPGMVLGFFTLSARQEYYALPALPALALAAGALLARADRKQNAADRSARASALLWSTMLLLPLTSLLAAAAAYFALRSPQTPAGTDIASLLARTEESYNLSLGHLFDLTPAAMGLFRGPLAAVAVAMLTLGPAAYLLRRSGRTLPANLTLAAASSLMLLAIHQALGVFYPILGSESLARSVLQEQARRPPAAGDASDLILIDGELTAGSTLLFYTQQPVHLVEGRMNGPWFGSFWPGAPKIFESEASLRQLWASPHRVFLLTYRSAERMRDLTPLAPVRSTAASGGKAILINRP